MLKKIYFKYIFYTVLSCFACVSCAQNQNIDRTPSNLNIGVILPFPNSEAPHLPLRNYMTTEFFRNPGLAMIKSAHAYSRGYTGKNITVAVIDSYIDPEHPDLKGAILPASTDLIPARSLSEHSHTHGTSVAGIIAARKNNIGMHGVAYNANVLAIRADIENTCETVCSYSWANIAKGIRYATDYGAQIINLSLGSGQEPNPTITKALHYAINKGVLFTIAAGNNHGAEPIAPAIFASREEAKGQVIAVGALDTSGRRRAYFSNKAGHSKNFYLLAPGENIYTTSQNGNYTITRGTSMASPHVAGALALLLEAFPNITPQTAIKILLESADDVGASGPDNENGWGILNLERALKPSGPLTITHPNTSESLVAQNFLNPIINAFGDWSLKHIERVVAVDQYKRAFTIKASDLYPDYTLQTLGLIKANHFFESQFLSLQAKSQTFSGIKNTIFYFRKSPVTQAGLTDYEKFKLQKKVFSAYQKSGPLTFGFGYGTPQSVSRDILSEHQESLNQYTGERSLWTSVKWAQNNWSLASTIKTGVQGHAYNFAIGKQYKNHLFALEAGVLHENNTLLGASTFQNTLGKSRAMETRFSTLHWQTQFKNWRLEAFGQWALFALDSSEFLSIKKRPEASHWGVSLDYFFDKASLSIGLSQPLRIEKGSANFSLPFAQDRKGRLLYKPYALDFMPSGREMDFDIKLRFLLNDRIETQIAYRFMKAPYHIEKARSQSLFWLGFKLFSPEN